MKISDKQLTALLYIVLLLALVFLLFTCKKKQLETTNLLVHVEHNGKPLDQPTIYLKFNSPASSGNYDILKSGDAVGEAYFENLKAGTYYLYCKGYSTYYKQYFTGTDSVILSAGLTGKSIVVEI